MSEFYLELYLSINKNEIFKLRRLVPVFNLR